MEDNSFIYDGFGQYERVGSLWANYRTEVATSLANLLATNVLLASCPSTVTLHFRTNLS